MLPSDLDNAPKIVNFIHQLTQDEGDSVTITNPNPDFGGPNTGIIVVRDFGPDVRYFGETVLECLEKAVASEWEERECENPACRGLRGVQKKGSRVRVRKGHKGRVECNECFSR